MKFIISKVIYHVKRKIFNKPTFVKKNKKWNLVICDDIFPHPVSGFKLAELGYILENMNKVKVITSSKSYKLLGDIPSKQFYYFRNITSKRKFNSSNKLISLHSTNRHNINTKLFYCIFYNNIVRYIDVLEELELPFVFTLYPGGGFLTDNDEVIHNLKRVCSSKLFRKVFVTQHRTKEYLLENQICSENQIEFIFGCVVPLPNKTIDNKILYPEKSTFDICFCANKYSPKGEDKGYPLFIDAARQLSKKYDFVRYHVIGNFDENTIDVSDLIEKITFHHTVPFEKLSEKYSVVDLLVSPNQSNFLKKSSFDGFPLGTAIEAAFNEVIVLTTDVNKENSKSNKPIFANNEEIILIEPDVNDIISKIEFLIQNPKIMKKVSIKSKEKFLSVFSEKAQMEQRIKTLKNLIDAS